MGLVLSLFPKVEVGTDGVQVLEIGQCVYSSSPTTLLTNLSLAAVVLQRYCERGHRHAQLPCDGVAVLASNHQALSLAFLDALRVEAVRATSAELR